MTGDAVGLCILSFAAGWCACALAALWALRKDL